MTKKNPPKAAKSKVLKKPAAKKAKPTVAKRSAALKPRPPLVAPRKTVRVSKPAAPLTRPVRRQATRSANARKPSSFSSMQVFWSAGILGGVLVVSSALWSAWQTPAPMPALPPPVVVQAPAIVPPAPVQPVVEPFEITAMNPSPELRSAFEQASRISTVSGRVDWWSSWIAKDEAFAHAQLASLGAGPNISDEAPLLPKKFDCTTFVETVIALARSSRPQLYFQKLIEVRYKDANPTYLKRNHFPDADWVPNNITAGIISDATLPVAQVASIETKSVEKNIDRAKWLAQQARKSPSVSRTIASVNEPIADAAPRSVKLAYLPREALLRSLDSLPQGVVINFVRENDARRPVLITHQGIVVREEGKWLLRHVNPSGQLRTVNLGDYLRKNVGFVGVTLSQVSNMAQGVNN